MIRRLLLLCALGALASESAYGLGLGKLELHSSLNQEFDAEIELTNVRGLGIDEILPSLASTEDFDRAGIERTYMLTDLRFKVAQKEDGRMVVRITSTRPIVEPFLNFIVEVLWPSGRILREYTVLLDPPVFGQAGVQPLKSAETMRPAQQIATRPQERPAPAPQAPAPATPAPAATPPATPPPTGEGKAMHEGSLANGQYGMTGRGDTLWSIALKVRPNRSVSVQQTMLAILRANPEAFISDNINLLKAGYVLRIPDLSAIEQETFASAVREVQAQNDEFEAYRSGTPITQLDASKRKQAAGSGPGSSEEGELRLVASDKSGNEAAGGEDEAPTKAATEQMQNELAVAREDLDRARRASSELNVRIQDLQGQINTLNNLVKLKDDQLAALRTEIQKVQAAARAQAQQAEQAPASKPVTSTIGSVTTNLMNQRSLLSNPYVLGLLALLVVAGVAGALIFMRRRAQADVLGAGDFDVVDMEEDEFEVADADDHVDEVESVLIEEDDDDISQQTTDVIGEAEIYIAYGRFPQAITFLQNAIEEEPDRTDIQLKLLEVYVQTEDAASFNRQLEQLKRTGDQDAISEALALQMAIPGAAEAAEASMGATMVSSEPVAEDDFSFDLDDLDAETEDDNFDLNSDLELDDSDGELELDLDLDASSSEAEEPELALDDIELDLDGEDVSLDDDDGIELSLGDDDDLELNLDEDASTKLDLARAYIDMGDSDGARNVLEEVIQEGSDSEIQEANELLAKID